MIYLNRYPLSTFGLVPTDLTGWMTAARGERSSQTIPGRTGLVFGAKNAPEPRVMTVGVLASLALNTDRAGIIARVESALMDQRVAVETVDRPNVQTWAVVQRIAWTEVTNAPKIAVPSIMGQITLLALDGGSEDVEPSAPMLLSTTPTAIPVGTLPTGGQLLVWGYTNPLTITYTPANGLDATTLTVATTVATGEHVAINLDTTDAFLATAAGTRTRITPTGTFPTLDPADATGLGLIDAVSATASPTITLSSGSGLWLGRRRWRL